MEREKLRIKNVDELPKVARDCIYLINFKLQSDKYTTKANVEVYLDNIKSLEQTLKINNIKDINIQKEVERLKAFLYKKQEFFKEQERLRKGILICQAYQVKMQGEFQ